MIKPVLAVSILALVGLPAAALAQEGPGSYVTVGYSQLETGQVNLGAITGRGGWKLRSWVGVEAEVSVGIDDDAYTFPSGAAGGVVELANEVAGYAVVFLPVNEHVELFARAGGGSSTVEASTPNDPLGNGESWNYGAGVNVFHGSNGLRADWTRKDLVDHGGETDSWSISYIRRF